MLNINKIAKQNMEMTIYKEYEGKTQQLSIKFVHISPCLALEEFEIQHYSA